MIKVDLSGKAAIVTGGGSGIGKAIAAELADCGARLWLGDISEQGAQDAVAELKGKGADAGYTKTDVSKEADMAALFDAAKAAYGRIDIVVNSAGGFLLTQLLDTPVEKVKSHLDVNLFGVMIGTRLALEAMIAQGGGGKIVNISSVGGRSGELESPYYCLGKSGIINLTQSAAFTGAPHGINVNALCPGVVRTPLQESILDNATQGGSKEEKDKLFDEIVKGRSPLGRGITPEEIAYAACFLCSSYADAIVGQALNVCGGWRMN
ncbi:MAG: SDR family oxidoreductase [Clostridiales Family XIII bacterium]|jgi:NAD(P)-dependent dehydrogenase (short-subunit alcohol dehydrogenase family)|nr:SDR family oxidoreductase [Clostridiales Family XIII bacterium]